MNYSLVSYSNQILCRYLTLNYFYNDPSIYGRVFNKDFLFEEHFYKKWWKQNEKYMIKFKMAHITKPAFKIYLTIYTMGSDF